MFLPGEPLVQALKDVNIVIFNSLESVGISREATSGN